MRTKVLALSAVVGALSSVAAMAQTNVYSLNGVGYITVPLPAHSYTILTCPLIESPDNTLNTVLPNTNGQYKKAVVYQMSGGVYTKTEAGVGTGINPSGWSTGGADLTLNPGQAVFFYNSTAGAMTATFVGQIPQGSLTNGLTPGYNLVGSIVPASGDLSSNPITQLTNIFKKDFVYTYDPTNGGYSPKDAVTAPGIGHGYNKQWSQGDPNIDQVGYGFFYFNAQAGTTNNWVENFTINP